MGDDCEQCYGILRSFTNHTNCTLILDCVQNYDFGSEYTNHNDNPDYTIFFKHTYTGDLFFPDGPDTENLMSESCIDHDGVETEIICRPLTDTDVLHFKYENSGEFSAEPRPWVALAIGESELNKTFDTAQSYSNHGLGMGLI